METRYEKLERPRRLPDEIAARLTRQIDDGVLKPGDKLPTEQALANDFAVARTVVREAISQLKSDGIINSRQGVGAFVADSGTRTVFRIGEACFAKRKELAQILQLRTSNEAEAAFLAAAHRSEADLDAMTSQITIMRESLEKSGVANGERRYEAERQLYRHIARASGNGFFVDFLGMLDGRIDQSLRSVAIKNMIAVESRKEVLVEHEAVFEAIVEQDAEAARIAARTHFANAATRLISRANLADV